MSDTENKSVPETMGNLDALSYFQAEGLNVGWNAGNTLDAYSNGVSGETKWGNPPLNQNLFTGLKEAGYNLVRIPITWMGHIGEAPDYPIEPDFLKRVAEVVGYAHQANLTVIINIHHDGHTDNNGEDAGWLSINKARASEDGMRQVTAQFEQVWAQIATYFRNYGDYLIFEDMNEIHDGKWGWGPEPEQKPQYEIVNQWNQVFVNAVRGTGGNNLTRYLIVPGYCTVGRHTVADYFRLPQDKGKQGNKLIVSFHYYDPYEFGIAGTRNEWGSTADKNKVSNDFQPFANRFIAMGIPVIIGESGAVRHPGYEQTRLDYLTYVYGKAHEFGLTPIYWDNGVFSGSGENFGLINRRTGQPDSDEAQTVIETMVNAAK
ncbi:MAG: glycoside hydrolase family 5 protein [Treponema sp.]|nr:glycoside hydrolase family 5 protein [Treponema sp.]